MISRRCSGCLIQQIRIGKHSMKSIDFELLQPVCYHGTCGYISFISEHYISICFKDIPLPESMNSRWGRHYANIIVYPEYWNEIRSCVQSEQEQKSEGESTFAPRSHLLQFGRRRSLGAAHQQDTACSN